MAISTIDVATIDATLQTLSNPPVLQNLLIQYGDTQVGLAFLGFCALTFAIFKIERIPSKVRMTSILICITGCCSVTGMMIYNQFQPLSPDEMSTLSKLNLPASIQTELDERQAKSGQLTRNDINRARQHLHRN